MLILIGPTNNLYGFHDHCSKVRLSFEIIILLLLDDVGEKPLSVLGKCMVFAPFTILDFKKSYPVSLIKAVMEALVSLYSLLKTLECS